MLFRKVTVPHVVTLPAIINVPEKEGLSLHFYLCQRGWKYSCCHFICTQDGKSLEKKMSISWMGNSSRDLPEPFISGSVFRLPLSFSVALVDIYRDCPASKYPWRDGESQGRWEAGSEGSRCFLSPPQSSWRARRAQAWLARCAIQEERPRPADSQRLFPMGTLESRAQRLQQPMSSAREPSHETKGVPGTQGPPMMAFGAFWSFGLHPCLSPFYEPGSPAFLVILWSAPHHHTHKSCQ